MIEISSLAKTYKDRKRGRVEAVRGVSFECRPGEIFGLLGPNGAGKTTTLRMISTAIAPTAGGGSVMGHDLAADPAGVRRSIGFLSADTGLYGRLTPREILRYFGRLFGMERTAIDRRTDEMIERFALGEVIDRPCDKLSTGFRQRVTIARAVFHDPPVLALDEPTRGLDVLTSRAIVDFVRDCRAQGRTILFSTHIMSEVERLCDRVAVIHHGRVCYAGGLDGLSKPGDVSLEDAFVRVLEEARA